MTAYVFGGTQTYMSTSFDPKKDAANNANHGISLARAADLEIMRFMVDDRYDYGEVRYRAWGHIDGASYCLVFTMRDGAMRPISLRKAHRKEMNRYVP